MHSEINLSNDTSLLDKIIIEAGNLYDELKYGNSARTVISCLQRSGVHLTKCTTSGLSTETARALSRAERLYLREEKIVENSYLESRHFQQFYLFLEGLEVQGYKFTTKPLSDSETWLSSINIKEMVQHARDVDWEKYLTSYTQCMYKLKASGIKFNNVRNLFRELQLNADSVLHSFNTSVTLDDIMTTLKEEDGDIQEDACNIKDARFYRMCHEVPESLDENDLTYEVRKKALDRHRYDQFRSTILSFYFYASNDGFVFTSEDKCPDIPPESRGRLKFHAIKSYDSFYYEAAQYSPLEMLMEAFSQSNDKLSSIQEKVILKSLANCGISIKTRDGIIHVPIMNGIQAEEPSLTVDHFGYDALSSNNECYRQCCEEGDIKKKFSSLFMAQ